MAEFTYPSTQAVALGGNVLFNTTPVRGNGCIYHREGSGIIQLSGKSAQCRALYKVEFGANIAIPTGGTVEEISLAIALNGEALPASQMRVTPAAVENFFNVSATAFVEIPKNICSSDLSVQNTSGQEVTVENANIVVTKRA